LQKPSHCAAGLSPAAFSLLQWVSGPDQGISAGKLIPVEGGFWPKVIIQHTEYCMLTYDFGFHTSFSTKLGKRQRRMAGLSGGRETRSQINGIGRKRRGGRAGPV
jgi:hypothetical protein